MRSLKYLFLFTAVLSVTASFRAFATNGSATYTGGSFTTGTVAGQSIKVSSAPLGTPKGALSFNCPITAYTPSTYSDNWTCAGGAITVSSANNSLAFSGTFLSGAMVFTSSGGGKGGHVTDLYQFTGSFSGTVTAGAVKQFVYGSVTQSVDTSSPLGTAGAAVTAGSFGWNSGYSPLLVGDAGNSRVLFADNIAGANLTIIGSAGTGVDQFGTVAGLAQDASLRLYATDSVLDRVMRTDKYGDNWTTFGSTGNGAGHFTHPHGLAIDQTGKIWVADTGNNRIVRFDDMTGANWTAYGSLGSGSGHFNAPSAIAFDAQGKIYVADTGNNRLVRIDNIAGLNWTTLTQVATATGTYALTAPSSLVADAAYHLYAGLSSGYLVRVDNIAGANGMASYWGAPITALTVDKAGTVYVGGNFAPGLAQAVDAKETGYFASALGTTSIEVSALLAVSVPQPLPPVPVLSSSLLDFGSKNVGVASAAQPLTITNIGAAPLTFKSLYATADYKGTTQCALTLAPGASCSGSVLFQPVATGDRSATVALGTNGVRPLLRLALKGTGTAPQPVLLPSSLSFDPQRTATASGSQTVTLTNTGTGPLTISSVIASASFSQSSNCIGTVAPGAGCTLQVTFDPTATGPITGTVTIADDAKAAGAKQAITLSGTGTSNVPSFAISPESLQFPDQELSTTSTAQTITLTNTSGGKVALAAATYPAMFSGSTTCGASLASGASCAYSIKFAPTASGPVNGTLSIPVTGASALHAGLSGTGVAAGRSPVVSANPGSIVFGSITFGDNPTLTTTLTNTSGLPAALASIALSGAPTFSITSNTCPAILGAKASCAVGITFLPISTSSYSNNGTLTITESTGAVTQVSVSGYAVAASAALIN